MGDGLSWTYKEGIHGKMPIVGKWPTRPSVTTCKIISVANHVWQKTMAEQVNVAIVVPSIMKSSTYCFRISFDLPQKLTHQ